MLKDITIGQYFPGTSPVHRMDPRAKIIFMALYIIVLFLAGNLQAMAVSILFILLGYAVSGIPLKMVLKSIKPVLVLIVFTGVLNMFFVTGEGASVVFSWKFITITDKGIFYAVVMAVRIICLIAGTTLLTYTTSPIVLTDGIERLMEPLRVLHVPVHEIAMMMTIALRFIPTLIEETDKIMSAQKARGADFESGGLMDKARSLVPILIPLFVSSFRRADELALAMECRCYHGGSGRTRMRQLKLTGVDYAGFAFCILTVAAVLVVNRMFPTIY